MGGKMPLEFETSIGCTEDEEDEEEEDKDDDEELEF